MKQKKNENIIKSSKQLVNHRTIGTNKLKKNETQKSTDSIDTGWLANAIDNGLAGFRRLRYNGW